MTEHHYYKMMLHLIKLNGFALGVIQGLTYEIADVALKEKLLTLSNDIEVILDETIGQLHEPR